MSLLCKDNVESRARRGKSWRNAPVALHVTAYRCFVKRSLESSTRPRYRIWGLQGIAVPESVVKRRAIAFTDAADKF